MTDDSSPDIANRAGKHEAAEKIDIGDKLKQHGVTGSLIEEVKDEMRYYDYNLFINLLMNKLKERHYNKSEFHIDINHLEVPRLLENDNKERKWYRNEVKTHLKRILLPQATSGVIVCIKKLVIADGCQLK